MPIVLPQFRRPGAGPSPTTFRRRAVLLVAGLLAALVAAALAGPGGDPPPPLPQAASPSPSQTAGLPVASDGGAAGLPAGVPPDAQIATVAKNVDGDTIWVEVTRPGGPLAAGAVHKIRILEIDTPESTIRTDCFGAQASEFARRQLAVGSVVYLAADKQDTDRYGRFLRYVWKADGAFYNEMAVARGYAKVVLYPPNDRFIARLREAESRARAAAAGFWSACVAGGSGKAAAGPAGAAAPVAASPVVGAAAVAAAGAPPPAAGGCHGSYRGACLPAGAEDVDCAGGSGNGPVFTDARNFRVVGRDDFGLDPDKDGVACEG